VALMPHLCLPRVSQLCLNYEQIEVCASSADGDAQLRGCA